jgi:uncharacterized phiE125 gp8 family phage protein
MPLSVVTPPTAEPITRAAAKLQCRILHTEEDELLDSMIQAARAYIENKTWRQIVRATLRLTMDRFPRDRWILLPRPRLVSVTSIEYRSGGAWVTLSPMRYEVDATGEPGRCRVDASGWPSADDELGAVRITFVTGWLLEEVPGPLKMALQLLVGGFYSNRDGILPPAILETVDRLIDDYCVRSLSELPYLSGTNDALTRMESFQ